MSKTATQLDAAEAVAREMAAAAMAVMRMVATEAEPRTCGKRRGAKRDRQTMHMRLSKRNA